MKQDVNVNVYKQKGLSLMELMVALLIMGVFAISTTFYLSHTSDQARLRSATENLYSALALAQAQALHSHKDVYFY